MLSGNQRRRQCFPRTRGDAPGLYDLLAGAQALPPHTRGCTPPVPHQALLHGASPAHAGMHPSDSTRFGQIEGFPRTRGDAPVTILCGHRTKPLPPHTRGCTPHGRRERHEGRASPAHAGMHPIHYGDHIAEKGFPRTRGDAPHSLRRPHRRKRLPPHTRGCTGLPRNESYAARASPAHAGMHPLIAEQLSLKTSFPRTRGDAPSDGGDRCHRRPLPPHTRGCTRRGAQGDTHPRASPAHAGMHPP